MAGALLVNGFFETRLRELLHLAESVNTAFSAAGIDYCLTGALAVYLYVEEREPDAGRLTRDVDIVVHREDIPRIADAAGLVSLEYRPEADRDVLVPRGAGTTSRAVRMLFIGEQVPDLARLRVISGLRLIPLADLVRMKLTSFRAKDETHVKDLDEAGLIDEEIENQLSPLLRSRLQQTRARD